MSDLKTLLKVMKDTEQERIVTIFGQLRYLEDEYKRGDYHMMGTTCLEIIQFCESLTELQMFIRSLENLKENN